MLIVQAIRARRRQRVPKHPIASFRIRLTAKPPPPYSPPLIAPSPLRSMSQLPSSPTIRPAARPASGQPVCQAKLDSLRAKTHRLRVNTMTVSRLSGPLRPANCMHHGRCSIGRCRAGRMGGEMQEGITAYSHRLLSTCPVRPLRIRHHRSRVSVRLGGETLLLWLAQECRAVLVSRSTTRHPSGPLSGHPTRSCPTSPTSPNYFILTPQSPRRSILESSTLMASPTMPLLTARLRRRLPPSLPPLTTPGRTTELTRGRSCRRPTGRLTRLLNSTRSLSRRPSGTTSQLPSRARSQRRTGSPQTSRSRQYDCRFAPLRPARAMRQPQSRRTRCFRSTTRRSFSGLSRRRSRGAMSSICDRAKTGRHRRSSLRMRRDRSHPLARIGYPRTTSRRTRGTIRQPALSRFIPKRPRPRPRRVDHSSWIQRLYPPRPPHVGPRCGCKPTTPYQLGSSRACRHLYTLTGCLEVPRPHAPNSLAAPLPGRPPRRSLPLRPLCFSG